MARTKTNATAAEENGVQFETALAELEQLVERLESGEQSLEDALQDFERGIALTRQCQQALKSAELRVQQLLARNGEETLEPFETDDT
ncbi:MAG TPA: exodeoxyribonuclease VII small subunit [Gammaproteobacteria bacterium]|nr:exodeoxyribonuclease VII small subunit [Gammaproteobacteria bacterium]